MTFSITLEQAQEICPQYTFVRALTESAQKAAFEVKDPQTDESLCLKIISPEYQQDRLTREIQSMIEIRHRNVANFREFTQTLRRDYQVQYVIEDFVAGGDLKDHISQDNPWPLKRAKTFFLQLFEGLEQLHSKSIVHRDIKPTNIRVDTEDQPVIIDLGLVRCLNRPDLTKTSDGAGIGTPIYFSPEQFRGGKKDIDKRTDYFAVGLVLYECLIGIHPYYNPSMTLQQVETIVCDQWDEVFKKDDFVALPRPWQLFIKKLTAVSKEKRIHSFELINQVMTKLPEEKL